MDTKHQQSIFKAMKNPNFYPHGVRRIIQKETHISKVFLTGDFVYKIKKPLNLGFLDFSTLEKRLFFCDQEICLNRRLAHDVYIEVEPISLDKGEYAFGKKGKIVEYAVKMRQLDESDSLHHKIKKQRVKKKAIDIKKVLELGEKLALFYLNTPKSDKDKAGDGWKNVFNACNDNFKQTTVFTKDLLDAGVWKRVSDATMGFLKNKKGFFMDRFKAGRVCDCHGDLRTGHIFFTDKGIQIIDCIEFNDSLRHIDAISDLAFLLMDLDFQGEQHLGDLILNEYLKHTKDTKAFMLLDFYKCYRAFVRCKVNCIFIASKEVGSDKSNELDENKSDESKKREKKRKKALKYLDFSHYYALRFSRPYIFVIHGMPGTGKSTIAKALGQALEIETVRSDLVRKKIFGLLPHERGGKQFKEKIYTSSASDLTYEKLLDLAQQRLDKGLSVIVDATFSREKHRKSLILFAKDKGITPVFVECRTGDEIIKKRLLNREATSCVSDARIEQFDKLKKSLSTLYQEQRYLPLHHRHKFFPLMTA